MKILLIRHHDRGNVNDRLPESLDEEQGVLPPLGISYIAAVLETAGYRVNILDAIALKLTSQEVKDKIIIEAPDMVGVTAMSSSILGALEALKMAKETGAITVIGGPHLDAYPRETLSYNFVDYGIIGEGEYPFLNLVRAVEKNIPVRDIKGLAYKINEEIYINEPYINPDLNKLPFPARHLLPMEKYSSIISLHPVTTMISSRGCPYQCGFCFKSSSDAKYRMRSPGNVVDEMELVVEQFKIKEIMFYDDTITLDRKHIAGICREIIKRGLKVKWESPSRIDSIDFELLKLMREAGCIRLRYGVESGDPQILELMNKRISLQKVKEVFRLTKKAGIETFAYFIIGYIHETEKTIKRTIALAKSLDPDLVMFTIATPYPRSPLYALAQKEGLIDGDYWKQFTLGARGDRLPYFVPDAEKWVCRAYRSFYFRPSYIIKSLFKIRSWQDIKKRSKAMKGLMFFKMN